MEQNNPPTTPVVNPQLPNEENQFVPNPTENTQKPAEMPPKKSNRPLLVLVGIVVIAVLTTGGFFAYKSYFVKKQIVQEPSPTPIVSSDPTADWKTFTSTKADYSFKYPKNWPLVNIDVDRGCATCIESLHFNPNSETTPTFSDSDIAIVLVFKDPRIKNLEDYENLFIKTDTTKIDIQKTTINGEAVISYKLSGGIEPLPLIEYVVVKNDFYYLITLLDTTETNKNREYNSNTFDQILSTFKFGNSNSTNVEVLNDIKNVDSTIAWSEQESDVFKYPIQSSNYIEGTKITASANSKSQISAINSYLLKNWNADNDNSAGGAEGGYSSYTRVVNGKKELLIFMFNGNDLLVFYSNNI